jgi:N-acetylmuramoyl-L-alanine amidase CwlA
MLYESLIKNKVIADSSNYKQASRGKDAVDYIVIHFTANDGDSDESNIKYFQTSGRKASAHLFVDDDSISMSVDLKDIAWHCGGSVYSDIKTTGGGTLHNICTNSNSIGIEMCDTVKNGKYDLSDATRTNTIKLVVYLMVDYDIDIDHVIRHFDVTGKYCPRYFCKPYGSDDDWKLFKEDIQKEYNAYKTSLEQSSSTSTNTQTSSTSTSSNTQTSSSSTIYRVRKTWSDVKSQLGAFSSLDNAKKACTDGYSVFDESGNVVYTKASTTSTSSTTGTSVDYKVKIICSSLRYRKGPGTSYSIVGTVSKNEVYTIVEEKNNWGKLKSGKGWISLSSKYVKKL